MEFNAANQVHIPSLGVSHAIKCRTTQSSKLGLMTMVLGADGARIPGVWLITSRGWAALRGEPVPASVVSFRNEIQERFPDKTITLGGALQTHKEKVEAALARGINPRSDYRNEITGYDAAMWVNIHSVAQGRLI